MIVLCSKQQFEELRFIFWHCCGLQIQFHRNWYPSVNHKGTEVSFQSLKDLTQMVWKTTKKKKEAYKFSQSISFHSKSSKKNLVHVCNNHTRLKTLHRKALTEKTKLADLEIMVEITIITICMHGLGSGYWTIE